MAVYRAQIGFPLNDNLPASMVTINPCYTGTTLPSAWGDSLVALIKAEGSVGSYPFTVKIYDALQPPPSYPMYSHVEGTGSIATATPNELALCLSYYATSNRPRNRGRIYIPSIFIPGTYGKRPTAAQMTAALNWKGIFSGLAGDIKGAVFSERDKVARPITNFWVDDEWDVVRSRGLPPTTRQLATWP